MPGREEAVQNEVREAVQIEASEAVQIEMQARGKQDAVEPHDSQRRPGLGNTSSPATAWPRRMCPASGSGGGIG